MGTCAQGHCPQYIEPACTLCIGAQNPTRKTRVLQGVAGLLTHGVHGEV